MCVWGPRRPVPHVRRQGQLGNCWFLSSMSVLAENRQQNLRDAFFNTTYAARGLYGVKFWKNGQWREIIIDDRLPYRSARDKYPLFAHCEVRVRGVGRGGPSSPGVTEAVRWRVVTARGNGGWGDGGWHKASVFGCLPLAAPIGLSPLLILTLCGPERVLVVSTEPPDDLSCLTTPGVGCPGDGVLPGGGGGGGTARVWC